MPSGPSMRPPFGQQQVIPVLAPVGAVMPYAGALDSDDARGQLTRQGWLLCDGRAVRKTEFPALYHVLGDAYGNAPSDDQFLLPDYRGLFLRGVNGDRSPAMDPDASSRTGSGPNGSGNTGNEVGSLQEDLFQEHEHTITVTKGQVPAGDNPPVPVVTDVVSPTTSVKCETGSTGSTECFGIETRPVNIYINFIIKAAPALNMLVVPAAGH